MSLKPSLYWLLGFIPITLVLEHTGATPPMVFFAAALAIIPIASLIVRATEQIAVRTGDDVGGLLNATFGHAPELIITIVALRAGLFDMVGHHSSGRFSPTCCSVWGSPSSCAAFAPTRRNTIPHRRTCMGR